MMTKLTAAFLSAASWGLGAFAFSAFAVWVTLPAEGSFTYGWKATFIVHLVLVIAAHGYGFWRGWCRSS